MNTENSIRRLNLSVPAIVFLLAALLLMGDALSSNGLLYGRDTVSHDYVVFWYGWRSIVAESVIPLWTPHIFAGIPFIGSFAFCPFYPPAIVSAFIPFPLGFNLLYLISLFIAGMAFYYMCFTFGFNRWTALYAGLMFMSSSHLVSLVYPGHIQKVQAIVWIPCVIAFARQYLHTRSSRYIILGGISCALQILASHLQIFFYTAQTLVLFLLYEFFVHRPSPKSFFSRVFAPFTGMIILAIALGGAQLFPGTELSAVSNRAPSIPYEQAIGGSFPPEELPELLLPRITGDSTEKGFQGYDGRWKERLVSDYLGISVWIFAFMGLVCSGDRKRWFFLGIFILSAFLACGQFSPLYRLFYHHVPFYNRFRSPATIMVLMTFSMVTIAATGFDWFWNKARQTSKTGLSATVLRICSSIFFMVTFSCVAFRLFSGNAQNTAPAYPFLILSLMWVSLFAGLVLLILSFIMKIGHYNRNAVILGCILLGVSFYDLRLNDRVFIQLMPSANYHQYLLNYWVDTTILADKTSPTPHRLLDADNPLIMRMLMREIATPHGYHPVGFKRYFDVLGKYGFISEEFLRLLHVTHITTSNGEISSRTKYIPIAQREKILLKSSDSHLRYVYMPEEIQFVPEGKSLKTLPYSFNPFEFSLIEIRDTSLIGRTIKQGSGEASFSYLLDFYQKNSIECRIKSDRDGYIVFSEPNATGWYAIIDEGAKIPLLTANHLFRALFITAGEHHIRLSYQPFSFRLGLYLTCITVFLILAIFRAKIFRG